MPVDVDKTMHDLVSSDLGPVFWTPRLIGKASAWWTHVPFAFWLMIAARPRVFVELGTHNGVSYAAFCEANVRETLGSSCFAVDTWKGDKHAGNYQDAVYNDLRAFHDPNYGAFSELLRCTFDEAVDRFADGSIDLLHIDGLHTYEAVRHDFETWLPKLSDRAIVLFHDTNVRRDDFGVHRLFAELSGRYPSFEFMHGHGLGLIIVGPASPNAIKALCAIDNPAEVGALRERLSLLGARWEALYHEADVLESTRNWYIKALGSAHGEAASLRDERAALREAADEARAELSRLRGQMIDMRSISQAVSKSVYLSALGRIRAPTAVIADLAARLAATEERAASEAAAARETRAQLDDLLNSTVWRRTAPLRRLIDKSRWLARRQAGRAKLVLRAVLPGNGEARDHLAQAVRHRLKLNPVVPPQNGQTAQTTLATPLAPHLAAVASYRSWLQMFDTPGAAALDHMIATTADRPDVGVIVRISADTESLVQRIVAALEASVGVNWCASFVFHADCAPAAISRYADLSARHPRLLPSSGVVLPEDGVLVLLEGGGLPRQHGLCVLAEALKHSDLGGIAYSDEDMLPASGLAELPWFKPDYDSLLMEQGVLFGRMVAIRPAPGQAAALAAQLADSGVDAAQLVRSLAQSISRERIVHLPHVLFHNLLPAPRALPLTLPPLPALLPSVSILIPTRDGWDLLGPCLKSLGITDWPADLLEIIVIDNASTDPVTLTNLAAAEGTGQIRLLRDDRPFNYARLNNLAARAAGGDLFVLLNNDTEIVDPQWLHKLAAHAMQPDVGAVGSKLLYPNRTVQHGGVVMGIHGIAAHAHLFLEESDGGYQGLANLTHQVSAVTGACLAVSRRAFEAASGLDEAFQVAFNDVVLCLDLQAQGLRNIYVADPLIIHHESMTRGYDTTEEKKELARTEVQMTWRRHAAFLRSDPFYSPNLSHEHTYQLSFAPRRRSAWHRPSSSGLRVMMLSWTHARGHGVAVVMDLQVRTLLAAGHQVVMAGPRSANDFDYGGNDVIEVHDPRSAASLAAMMDVDLVVVHTPPFYAVARWTGAFPKVLAYDYGEPPADLFPDAVGRRDLLAEKTICLGMCTRVLAISRAVADEAVTPPDGILRLGNGHLGRWHASQEHRRILARRNRGWEHACIVFNVCRFHEGERVYKGVDHYIEVFEALQIINPDLAGRTKFVLCGKGDPADVAAMEAKGLHVLANVTDTEMGDLYAAADVYMNFSRWEGYNLGIGQALAMGLPVVASDIPAHRAFGVKVTDSPIDAAIWLTDLADMPPQRKPIIWEWDAPLARFVNEVEALCGTAKLDDSVAGEPDGPDIGGDPMFQLMAGGEQRLDAPTDAEYAAWVVAGDTLTDTDRELIRSHVQRLSYKPLISVVMPVYDTPRDLLLEAIASVRSQLYPHWELCIADDASPSPEVAQVLEAEAAADSRIRWLRRSENGHISAASNSALELATGEFVAFFDHDDLLSEHALYEVAVALNANRALDIIYSDQDHVDDAGFRFAPYFKPDWDPDLLLGQNSVSHLAVYRRDLITRIGGFREGFEGSQDHDLTLRASEVTQPGKIHHIPAILYHWRRRGDKSFSDTQLAICVDASRRAIEEHLPKLPGGQGAQVVSHPVLESYHRVVWPLPDQAPKVSIIIPTRNGAGSLARCAAGVLNRTDYPDFELLVVDNGSIEAPALEVLHILERDPRVKIVRDDRPFNSSALTNQAAREATGEVLVLFGRDTDVIEKDWLREMVSQAMRPDVGTVGARLISDEGFLQHAGIVLGVGNSIGGSYVAGNFGYLEPTGLAGYFGLSRLARTVSANSGACLAIRRDVFLEVGGLDEVHLPNAFNDVDLCLRVRARGLRNVWTPFAELLHFKSASLGSNETPERIVQLEREAQYMRERWGEVLDSEPFYSIHFSRIDTRYRLDPGRAALTKSWLGGPASGMVDRVKEVTP